MNGWSGLERGVSIPPTKNGEPFGGFPAIRKLDSDYLMLFDHHLFLLIFPIVLHGWQWDNGGLPWFTILLAAFFSGHRLFRPFLPLPGRPSVLEGLSDA